MVPRDASNRVRKGLGYDTVCRTMSGVPTLARSHRSPGGEP